jgi:hypothetical protein
MSCSSSVLSLNSVPLQNAVLCVNCEVVSDSRNGHCVVCGSASLLCLARVLGERKNPQIRAWFAERTLEKFRTGRELTGSRTANRLIRSIPPRFFALAKR